MALLVTLFLVLVNIFNAITTNSPKADGLNALQVRKSFSNHYQPLVCLFLLLWRSPLSSESGIREPTVACNLENRLLKKERVFMSSVSYLCFQSKNFDLKAMDASNATNNIETTLLFDNFVQRRTMVASSIN